MSENKEELVVKFDETVDLMHEKEHLSAKEGDDAKYQFDDFIDNIAQKNFKFLGLTGERIVLTIFLVIGLDDFFGQRLRRILCGRYWSSVLSYLIDKVRLNVSSILMIICWWRT